ncbi:hypothetical protein LRR18_17330, partial [Mangrovimonas sp. AS39]|uniref:hypothetical protein n=1 Tax=Mangrovimonas futianensis TaxID=2895523 RepID=UPI001E4F552D
MLNIVHGTGWCGQPEITILCSNASTTPAYISQEGGYLGMEDIYLADNSNLYTFNEELITCKECLEKLA